MSHCGYIGVSADVFKFLKTEQEKRIFKQANQLGFACYSYATEGVSGKNEALKAEENANSAAELMQEAVLLLIKRKGKNRYAGCSVKTAERKILDC